MNMKNKVIRTAGSCLIILLFFCMSCAKIKPSTERGAAREFNEPQAQEQVTLPTVSVNVVQLSNDRLQVESHPKPNEQSGSTPIAAAKPANKVIQLPEKTPVRAAQATTTLRRVPSTHKVIQYLPDTSRSLGTEILLSEISQEIAGKIFYELREEGERVFTARVAVVNAVPLSNLKRETEFGRIIAEYLLTDLADRGLRVTELRMGSEINILPQTGEFIMSRNIGELANNTPALDYVVISTFTNTRKTLIVQGRLVNLKNGLIRTTWRHSLPLNRELLGLFHTVEQPFTISVKGMYR